METFYFEHQDGITNKDAAAFIDLFRSEINNATDSLLRQTADYFVSKRSVQGNLTVLTRVRDVIKKSSQIEAFQKICDHNLLLCFYLPPQEDPSTANFNSAYNYSVLFSKEALFSGHEVSFIRIISILTKPTNFMNFESISISAKLLEKFFEYQKSPIEIDFNLYTTIASTFNLNQTTYSALGTICIESIKVHSNFEVACCFVRCLSRSLAQLFDDDIILGLFLNEENDDSKDSKLRLFLIDSLPYHYFLLLLSNFVKKFPKKGDALLHLLEKILGNDSNPIERCFGYTALLRIVPFIDHPIDFSIDIIKYLLRDYDSQNPILPSILENLYKAALKKCKSANLVNQLNQKLYESIKNLSWHSMVKLMIIPDIIHSFPDLFGDLLDFAQDPSDYGFVTRCVKTIAKSSPNQTSEDLLKAVIDCAMKTSIYNNLRTYRPLLEPLYSIIPEIVPKAFDMFNQISNNNKIYNDSNEIIIPIWLRFESLLVIPRSKWPIQLSDLFKDLQYAIHSGNWDLRCSSLIIFAKCFNTEEIPLDFIMNLKTLMFTDSVKHTFLIEDSFTSFIDALRPHHEIETENILLNLLDVFSYHMSSTFISSHRQFALSLTETLWKKYPHLFNQKHLDAIVSILYDNSLSLRFLCRDKIKAWIKEDPNKKFNLSSVPQQLLFDETDNNQNRNTIEYYDSLLKKLINDITNNNFESLKELETLINDNKSSTTPSFSKEVLDEQSEKYFDFYISTKNVGISYRSQTVFVSLCNLLEPQVLANKLNSWESRLLSILRDFDMESMRRSASLPDVALSLIRLQPPELVMKKDNDLTSHMAITTALIDLLKRTNVETEAVNSLNVLRAVLKDKIMSKIDDYLYPMIFEAIFITSMKFSGWDFVAASNLCFSGVFQKLFKRSDKTINIKQFFQKIPKAKDLVIEGLQSKITHANYLALTVLTAFKKTNGDDLSLLNYVIPYISSRSSRIRRTAAIALLLITPDDDIQLLYNQCIHFISLSRFVEDNTVFDSNKYFEMANNGNDSNSFHGLILVIREIFKKNIKIKIEKFPSICLEKVPPLILDDISFIFEKLNKKDLLKNFSFKFSRFYFDQVSTIIYSSQISDQNKDLNDSQLVALLTKVNSKIKHIESNNNNKTEEHEDEISNDEENGNDTFEFVSGLDILVVNRLKKQPLPPLIFKLCVNYLNALLKYSNEKNVLSNLGFKASNYLNDQIDPEIQISLIDMLNGTDEIKRFIPLFINHAFNKDDSYTPIKIAIARKLPHILQASPDSKIIALILLIDDVPLIRTKAAIAVSHYLKTQFLIEVELFDLLLKNLDEKQLKLIALKWIELIELKEKSDPNGESISTLVDEFYVVQKVLQALKLGNNIDFTRFQFIPISDARIQFVNSTKPYLK
ncbi:hypothetical protein M9Y10_021190 [Tritrichomonas musculus]|uniref:DUF2428 domain-containing protein n=1 Tax=Tritrichomonas musculus TaxID=1915356 RepID=A0ABR2HDB9_9EUKA